MSDTGPDTGETGNAGMDGFGSLLDVGDLLRRGQLSPVELTAAMLGRIERLDPILHAYLAICPERALEQARRAESEIAAGRSRGLLHGIPIAVKDLCDTRGIATTSASTILQDHVPETDATVVSRLEAAGAVLLGKLNLTEFAMHGYHPSLPVPRNPWNLERHTNGSSSGSAAATAAGLCFASLGTDTGGSIRGPSSWCGVVGLKPTYGRVSRHGVFPLAASLDHVGPMTRTVADAAAVLEVIAGFDPLDPTSLHAPVPPLTGTLDEGVAGLRIGIDEAYVGAFSLPDVAAAVASVARTLAQAGATLVPVRIPDTDDACRAWIVLCSSEAHAAHAPFYPARAAEYGASFRSFLDIGARQSGADYARAHLHRLEFAGRLQEVFRDVDLVLCPGTSTTAAPAAQMPPDLPFSEEFWPFLRFTAPFNLSGNPTLSLPAGFDDEALPLGVQLVARHGEEPALCRAGHTFQRSTHWHGRRPPHA